MTTDPRADLPYAQPRLVETTDDCYFYHSMELPGLGPVEGDWDLRGGEDAYLGHVELEGKRVLEVGTASGFLCFHMERQGAEVVAYDLSPEHAFDIVPYGGAPDPAFEREVREHVAQLNNAFWLSHRLHGSRARVAYGTAYAVPAEIGPVDVSTLCSVLLHLRDPFLALQNVLRLTRETVVVTDRAHGPLTGIPFRVTDQLGRAMLFRPDEATREPPLTWWRLSPRLVERMIGVLGFGESRTTYHEQLYEGRPQRLFTVVGRRTAAMRAG